MEKNKDSWDNIIPNRYHCIDLNCAKVSYDTSDQFDAKLKEYLAKWKSSGLHGVWIKAPLAHAAVIPVCVQHGFVFHHAQTEYVMLKKWLLEGQDDTLPNYANHFLGAGGFVVNSKNQILVIKERFQEQPTPARWKLPGGLADPGEDISAAAEREVLEETGIRCQFDSVLCFRHLHKYKYGCSDLYFVCLMKPLSEDIKIDPKEIAECIWMDIDEFIAHPDLTDLVRHFGKLYKESGKLGCSIQQYEIRAVARSGFNKVYSAQRNQSSSEENI